MAEAEERCIDAQPLIEISRSAKSEGFNIFDYIWLYKMPYLTREQLSGYNRYKYASIDTSPLSKYVMHPFWNWGVTFFPTWVAPNVMTFAGWILLAIDFGLMSHYDWNFTAANDPQNCTIPRWVWFIVAWNHFWSHQLDGMDGKQARRTGSGGPLGELMDHGIDSNCIWMLPITLMSAIGSDPATHGINLHYTPILLVMICFSFYAAHWEKYSTGILYLPWMFDIAQLSVVGLFITVGIMSPAGLKAACSNIIPLDQIVYIGIPLGASASLIMSCYNVYCSIKDGTCKTKSFAAMMKPWVSYIIFNSLFLLFAHFCSDALVTHTRIYVLAYGATFSNIVCRLMINQMSDSTVDLIMPPIIPLTLAVFLAVVCQINPGMVITIYSIFAIAAFVHYCYVIVNQLCDHLHICAFSITQKR